MFNPKSKERAAKILTNYGATHFLLSADGELSAVVGAQYFKVTGGQQISIGESDEEIAANAIEKAALKG